METTPLNIAERQALSAVTRRLIGKRVPTNIARYRVLERLGEGGCGLVFRAWDPKLDRHVALKVVQPKRAKGERGEAAQARLLREAQSLARLRHPNIVEVFDMGLDTDGESPAAPAVGVFVVMELIRGVTLRRWLRERPRSWREILDVYIRAARGLEAAHASNIVHRDLKPDNIMITRQGEVKVLDFGLARSDRSGASHSGDETHPSDYTLTADGTVVGTPRYMSPEQHEGGRATPASDQFGWCACLFEALYGSQPFRGGTLELLVEGKRAGPPKRPRSDAVPSWVYRVLARGLQFDPARRHASFSTLLRTIERHLQPPRRGAIAGSLAAALAAAGVWAAIGGQVEPAPIVAVAAVAGLNVDAHLRERMDGSPASQLRRDLWTRVETCEGGEEPEWFTEGVAQARELRDPRLLAALLHRESQALMQRGREREAGRAVQEAVWIAASIRDDELVLNLLPDALHVTGHEVGDTIEFERLVDLAQRLIESAGNPARPRALVAVVVAEIRMEHGDFGAARSLFDTARRIGEEELGGSGQAYGEALMGLGFAALEAEKIDEAQELFLAARPVLRDDPGEEHPAFYALEDALADVAIAREDYDAAAEIYGRLLASAEIRFGPDSPEAAWPMSLYGSALVDAGHMELGIGHIERAVELVHATDPPHPAAGAILFNLAAIEFHRGNYERVLELNERARRTFNPHDYWLGADSLLMTTDALVSLGRLDEAVVTLRQAEMTADGHTEAHVALTDAVAARLALAQGRYADAEQLTMTAMAGLEKQRHAFREQIGMNLWTRARALDHLGEHARARVAALEGRALIAHGESHERGLVDEIDAWLGSGSGSGSEPAARRGRRG